jgi:asparagine synthase (glutamine-hydrolysing)
MCGIVGFLYNGRVDMSAGQCRDIALKMAHAIAYRGPDDFGVWVDEYSGVGLAHRRLSVIDLSPAGHQPMVSQGGRFVMVFNGEIYNHLEMRDVLESERAAPVWKGHSDTETLLAAIEAWGLENTLRRARGMFGLGLWDRQLRCFTLARDRIGEKPLYYGMVGSSFVFASELKAVRAVPGATLETEAGALALMLRYGYVPSPWSIYRGIFKLPAGAFLKVSADGSFGEPEVWWDFGALIASEERQRRCWGDEEAVDELESLLGAAVGEQMVADVPLGALLSGGIDSSLVVALMQARSERQVRTFTIGFSEGDYNEAEHAARVASHLGTEHTELKVTPQQALDIIPKLPHIYDEPFADASQIPTALVCALTRRYVTVCLSGDAGDELFGGYNRYLWASSLWSRIKGIPKGARSGFAAAISAVPAPAYNRGAEWLGSMLPIRWRLNNPGDKLHKLAEVFAASTQEALYGDLVSQWRRPLPLRGVIEPATMMADERRWPHLKEFDERMMALDTMTYLPDDILVKVDRAAMAASLETRVPFLDERVIKFAWSLPLHMKLRHGRGKWILRQLLHRHVPVALFERPKQGFGVPIEHWLRGPLREWAEDLLSPQALSGDELLDAAAIRAMWDKHLSGRNVQYALWGVLMYQAWKRQWMS